MGESDQLAVVASQIKKLSFGDLMEMATFLSDWMENADAFEQGVPSDVAALLHGWADNYLEDR